MVGVSVVAAYCANNKLSVGYNYCSKDIIVHIYYVKMTSINVSIVVYLWLCENTCYSYRLRNKCIGKNMQYCCYNASHRYQIKCGSQHLFCQHIQVFISSTKKYH